MCAQCPVLVASGGWYTRTDELWDVEDLPKVKKVYEWQFDVVPARKIRINDRMDVGAAGRWPKIKKIEQDKEGTYRFYDKNGKELWYGYKDEYFDIERNRRVKVLTHDKGRR